MRKLIIFFITLFILGCQKEEFPKQITIPPNMSNNSTTECTYMEDKDNKNYFELNFFGNGLIDLSIGQHDNFVVSILSYYKKIESFYIELLVCDKTGNVLYGKSFDLPKAKDKDSFSASFFLTKDNGLNPSDLKDFKKLIKKLKLSKENILLIRLKKSKNEEPFDNYYMSVNFSE